MHFDAVGVVGPDIISENLVKSFWKGDPKRVKDP